jgi:integrase
VVSHKRRGAGEGSIFQRKDGRWACSVSLGCDARGKRRRKTVYGKTQAEVQEKLEKLRQEPTIGLAHYAVKLTVGMFLIRWLEDTAKQTVRQTTYACYESTIRLHIVPEIGHIRLSSLTPMHLQDLYARKLDEGLSPRSVQIIHAVLHRALKQAHRWGMVSHNTAAAVDRPRAPKKQMHYLTPSEVSRFWHVAAGNRFYALYVLAVTTGMRQGELLGLQWIDVDLAQALLTVRRSLTNIKGTIALGEPKSAAGSRYIALPQIAVRALDEHRERMLAEGLASSPWVFCDTVGGPIHRQNLVRRSFKPLLQKAGLPDIRFHDLRHTAATLLLFQGVHPKVVQEILGHSQISVTLDTYSHVLPALHRDAADKLDQLFGQRNPEER